MEQKEVTKYSDIKKASGEKLFADAEKVDPAIILNKKIIILDFKILPSTISDGKEFCVIKANMDGKTISFSSGEVVGRQLNEVKDNLPLETTITKVKGKGKFGYYSLS